MKKYFLLAAAAATVLAVSCNKEKNQPKVDPTPGTEIEDNTPQPIRFGVSTVEVKSPITKAAIENTTAWPEINSQPQKLYIYGFQLNNGTPTITADAAILNNVEANAPTTLPGEDGNQRKSIYVQTAGGDKYYYGTNGEVYNFYGYYGGTATIAPTIAESAVTASVTIDGSQDIMLATTDKFADYIHANSPAVSLDKIYSEVSARKNVVPDLKFKHQLARFKFETKYGGNGNNTDINIVSIQMMSVKTGTLTIAAANAAQGFSATVPEAGWPVPADTPGDDKKYGFTVDNSFTLKNAAGDAAATGNPGNGVFAPFGESIMTFPQGLTNNASPKYHLLLTLTQTGRLTPDPDDDPAALEEFYVPMDIDFATVVDANGDPIINKYAEAGKMYVIRLMIYGAEEIKMTVSLEDWEYGGETEIDPDQDPRPVPVISITAPDPEQTLNLYVAATQQITASASYTAPNANASTNVAVKYGTTNKKVATVDNNGLITAVKAGDCKIYVYVEGKAATEQDPTCYQGAMKAIDVVVLPIPVFAGLPAAAITTDNVNTADYTTTAVFTTCTYGDTPTNVDAADISIEVKNANNEAVNNGFTYHSDTRTITVASGTAAGAYSVTLKVAGKADTYSPASANPFIINVVNQ